MYIVSLTAYPNPFPGTHCIIIFKSSDLKCHEVHYGNFGFTFNPIIHQLLLQKKMLIFTNVPSPRFTAECLRGGPDRRKCLPIA